MKGGGIKHIVLKGGMGIISESGKSGHKVYLFIAKMTKNNTPPPDPCFGSLCET